MRRIGALIVLVICTSSLIAQNSKTVFLVRHGEKVSEAKDAVLSDIGKQRAMCLAGVLADAGVESILASDVQRTQQTAQPLADQLHKKLTIIPAADTAKWASEIKAAPGNVLVVGHSDTLPKIILQLTGKTVNIGSNDYDDLFIVTLDPNPSVPVLLHYCKQSAPGPPQNMMVR